MSDTENTQEGTFGTTNDNGTVNPPANQGIKLAASPKTPDEKEFGPGVWVFSHKLQRPIVTGAEAGSTDDRVKLDAKNVDEAIQECKDRDLYGDITKANVTNEFETSDTSTTEEEANLEKLRQRATDLGVENANRMKEDTLNERIAEAEREKESS